MGQACSVWAGGLWEEARRWGLAYAPSYSLGSPHKELTLELSTPSHLLGARTNKYTWKTHTVHANRNDCA